MDQSRLDAARSRGFALMRKNCEKRLSSCELTKSLALMFRDFVNLGKYKDTQDLIRLIKAEGNSLAMAYPSELIVHNVLCATLKIVRDEAVQIKFGEDALNGEKADDSLYAERREEAADVQSKQLRKNVMGSLEELAEEYSNSEEDLTERGAGFICDGENVLTFRYSVSHTVQEFLRGCNCQIISVDDEVAQKAEKVTVISLDSLFPLIRSVKKIVFSAVAVFANGSCALPSGCRLICEAAAHLKIPVIICTALYKLTPMERVDLECLNRMAAVGQLLSDDWELLSLPNVAVSNPVFDYIPASLVTSYVTQHNDCPPEKVRQLMSEYYNEEDISRCSV